VERSSGRNPALTPGQGGRAAPGKRGNLGGKRFSLLSKKERRARISTTQQNAAIKTATLLRTERGRGVSSAPPTEEVYGERRQGDAIAASSFEGAQEKPKRLRFRSLTRKKTKRVRARGKNDADRSLAFRTRKQQAKALEGEDTVHEQSNRTAPADSKRSIAKEREKN